MLVAAAELEARRQLASPQGPFAGLADSLGHDLERLTCADEIHVPVTKARLTRAGGRCPRCGAMLDFDPWSPQRHRCAHCGFEAAGEEHHGMWRAWYQLWLAERALHAAALYATRGTRVHRALAERILTLYADRYLKYPNRDNVLGPTRVFFSTYLESIWTLQLACALDVLEAAGPDASLGAAVRAQILEPSAALIAQYDEGLSNRQVWNNAALQACGWLLGDVRLAEHAVTSRSGLLTHLEHGLLADGTWYEGENYHLFAHRGLWYGMTLATRAGLEVPAPLRARHLRAFETPFLTALPDFTFPSRRDAQYRVSLRQWRIAESCELGLVEGESVLLSSALGELYRTDIPRRDPGRERSTAEAERNVPGSRLTRADLGWKSLLFARREVPEAASMAPLGSVLLPDQGFAVLRRDQGRTYVALDYGESGGGHGHPDRLNLWLVVDDARILEDVGTGSYVDPSLHWYRSTLAHNAPLADGRSQRRVDGELLAYHERGEFGWTLARATIAPNVEVQRAVVAAADYLVDELLWVGEGNTLLDLPYHLSGTAPSAESWSDAPMLGADGLEDGFEHLTAGARAEPATAATITGLVGSVAVTLWLLGDAPFVLWRVRGPGPPNELPREFFVARSKGATGRIRTVIDWTGAVKDVRLTNDAVVVTRADGSQHAHGRREDEWHVTTSDSRPIVLASTAGRRFGREHLELPLREARVALRIPRRWSVDREPSALARVDAGSTRVALGETHYRRTEETWDEAGRPHATVAFAATAEELHIDIVVEKLPLAFSPPRAENPLDNEHPDINSDGVQLYLERWSWLLVPDSTAPNVRVAPRQGLADGAPAIRATWQPTSRGYAMRIVAPLAPIASGGQRAFVGDVIVNEKPPDRERRRGQLVLSGSQGEWGYLRGDRQDPSRFLQFLIADA